MLIWWVKKKYLAGSTVLDAVHYARKRNNQGVRVLLNFLGEQLKSKKKVEQTLATYEQLLQSMHDHAIIGGISVKLTQLGLRINNLYCQKNLIKLSKLAQSFHYPVWIDTEEAPYISSALNIFLKAHIKYPMLGITLQVGLKRSKRDLERLKRHKARIRLVKGAYKGGLSPTQTEQAYSRYATKLSGSFFSTGTHDQKLLNPIVDSFTPGMCEFQFLKGVNNAYMAALVKKGYPVSEYVPFGKEYSVYVRCVFCIDPNWIVE